MRYVKGYLITWKQPQDVRKALSVSIEAGMECIRQWSSGSATLLIKGACYATNQISSIEPIYAAGELEIARAKSDGKSMNEQIFLERLQAELYSVDTTRILPELV